MSQILIQYSDHNAFHFKGSECKVLKGRKVTPNECLARYLLPLAIGLCLRGATSLHSYSGEASPPMYGDFEAQRHWMEITVNLPVDKWYRNSSDNDLNYWGLDYPPLTAYHSFILGNIGQQFNNSWFDLFHSRGLESPELKLFMRYTVIFSDLLTFIPAAFLFSYFAIDKLTTSAYTDPSMNVLLMLMFPGLIIIDHGHFQYNCVSLGLFLAALALFIREFKVTGTMCFCLALTYKQMEFYHALPFFFFLLGGCRRRSIFTFFVDFGSLSISVCATLFLIFFPFCFSLEPLLQVILRMFPVDRGLYEDIVANFWCISSVCIKWKALFSHRVLLVCCSLLTLLSTLPACLLVLWRPSAQRLVYTQVLVSLAFFLFSFQVHEKSVLLISIPTLCLLPVSPFSAFYFSVVSTLSMWPLLVKDHLPSVCVALLCTFYLAGCISLQIYKDKHASPHFWFLNLSILVYFTIFVLEAALPPPVRYPFLFPFVVSGFSFIHFAGFFAYWYWELFELPNDQ